MRPPPFDKCRTSQMAESLTPAVVVVAQQPVQAAAPAQMVNNTVTIPDRSTTTKGLMLPEDLALGTSLAGRATALETRATSLEGRATALEATDAAYGPRITSLEGRATALETRVTALEALRTLKLLNASFNTPAIGLLGTPTQQTYTVAGATVGMGVLVNVRAAHQLGQLLYGWVSAPNTVIVEVRPLIAVVSATIAIDIHVIP